jgi:hypothetical protein
VNAREHVHHGLGFLMFMLLWNFEKRLGRLRKMIVANHNRQHQNTLDTFFVTSL